MEPIKLIKPSHIDTSKHFFGAFNNAQREVSANWIVSFCRDRNNDTWEPFLLSDLDSFHQEEYPNQKFLFNGLDEIYQEQPKYGIAIEGDRVIVHNKFIAACYQAAWEQ